MFKAGIIGCGRIGSQFDDNPRKKTISSHAGAYTITGETELVAACDLDEEKLQKCGQKWTIPSLYKDYKEMLRGEKLDIVSICTPNSTHLDIVKEAIKTGIKAILCEKPIADSLKNADEMIRLCQDKKKIFLVNHQRRFDKFHRQMNNLIQSGYFGKIQQVNFCYTSGIANTGSHLFDLLHFFFGDVDWVQAVYSNNNSYNPEDPNIDGILRFKNGTFCTVQACSIQYFRIFEMDCIGTNGRFKITHGGRNCEFYRIGLDSLNHRKLIKTTPPIRPNSQSQFILGTINYLLVCLKEQLACLKKQEEPFSTGENGRAALELICAFHQSARSENRRIELPLRHSEIKIRSK